MRNTRHPISRAHYWLARTAEALGQNAEARSLYERAARASTTYYGQMAHARIGGAELRLPAPPTPHPQGARLEIVRAMDMLYADRRTRSGRLGHRRSRRSRGRPGGACRGRCARRTQGRCAHAGAARSHRGRARSAVRILRLSDCGIAARQADRRRRTSSPMSPMRSRGRKAASTRVRSPAPRRRA